MSSSPIVQQLCYVILLILFQIPYCDADGPSSSETIFSLQCPGTIRETSDTINGRNVTVVHPGDRVILDFQAPQTVSIFPTDNCTLFNNNESLPFSSHVNLRDYHQEDDEDDHQHPNQTIITNDTDGRLANRDWHQFHMEDVNKSFTFVCHEKGAEVGCNDTLDRKIQFQVQPILVAGSNNDQEQSGNGTNHSNSTAPPTQPQNSTKTRSRSRPIHNNYEERYDYGLIFLAVLGVLGLIALVMNCGLEYRELQVKAEADRIACELNNS